MHETRLMKGIADLRRLTNRSRKARATALARSVHETEKTYQRDMLDLYDALLVVIDQHAGAAEMAADAEANRIETSLTGRVNG